MSDGFVAASSVNAKARKAAKTKRASTLISTQPKRSTEDDEAVLDDDRAPLIESDQGDNDDDDEEDAVMIDTDSLNVPSTSTATATATLNNEQLSFPAVDHAKERALTQRRKVTMPAHRMTPLKRDWIKIYTPLVEECGLQVRMNPKKRQIECKTSKHTPAPSSLTRAVDFLNAYALGFAVEDAIAMLRLEELYIESFEIKDVKTLHGDHLSRAIGRIAGHEGKTRFTIENASRTRIVLADTKIHILGTFANIKIARDAICALILGSAPGKVIGGPSCLFFNAVANSKELTQKVAGLRIVANRARERF